ncbi:hypothetical protein ATE47_00400 [Chryseobacterium sp. IHB B 17019]|nr:hypothetical protein ATE47_00400 [Chryseobacterium sp. IHB B 17019]
MHEREISGKKQVDYLIKIIAFFWLITKVWSYKTWITERIYPVIPPLDILKNVPDFLHVFLFGCSLLALLMILFKESRLLLVFLFFSELLSCLLDTARWQPWEYTYMCFILIVIVNFHKPKNIVFLSHLFLVSIYLFSGLHKLNRDFLVATWLNMVLTNFLGLPMVSILKYKLFFVGLIIPFVEILLAILLFSSKSKRKISYLLMLIHLGILVLIGPFGLGYNSVVWFWNLAMIFILMIIYVQPIEVVNRNMLVSQLYWFLLWFVMPVFSLFGSWYQYFSFNLYSGKGDQMYICISGHQKELSPYFETKGNFHCKGTDCINLQNWAMKEIKSSPIPEIEIYKKIGAYLKHKYPNNQLKIILYNAHTQKSVEL